MQNLLNALVTGTVEYQDNGVQIAIPPNAIMLKAARALKQLLEVNDTNNLLIQQLQAREAIYLAEQMQFRVEQASLLNQLSTKEQNERNQSIRDDGQQTGIVGDSSTQRELFGCDQPSEGGSADTHSGTGTN